MISGPLRHNTRYSSWDPPKSSICNNSCGMLVSLLIGSDLTVKIASLLKPGKSPGRPLRWRARENLTFNYSAPLNLVDFELRHLPQAPKTNFQNEPLRRSVPVTPFLQRGASDVAETLSLTSRLRNRASVNFASRTDQPATY